MIHPVIFAVLLALLVGLVVGVMFRDRHDAKQHSRNRADVRRWCTRAVLAECELARLKADHAIVTEATTPLPRPRTQWDRDIAAALQVGNAR